MEMLNGVLNLSKLEAGEMGLEPEPLDLSEEVRDVAEAFQLRAEENGLQVRIEAPAEPVRARANGQGIQIVLRNLLSNAIKYTEEGGTVWVRSRRLRAPEDDAPTGARPSKDGRPLEDGRRAKDAPTAVLEVEDTGIGMNADFLDQAFDAFHQESRGRAREFEGTGLGLAVVEKTVAGMNGCVEVDSQKGEGTRVTVRLPAAEA
jgi:signal transduction histidine kinase